MKVAIVAVGELARYFVQELLAQSHQVVTISRSKKDYLDTLGVTQHISDYSTSSLTDILHDCDAVICTIRGGVPNFTAVHSAILEACQKSPTCKRFIPSAWAGNLEEFPDEPLEWADELQPMLQALSSQKDVSWSAICPGWYADYVYPAKQRYLGDIGEMWPQNYKDKVFTLYGKGSQLINFTSVRDTARATIMLLAHDRHEWENYTYLSGEQLTWKQLSEFITSRDGEYTVKRKSLATSIKQYIAKESEMSVAVAIFEIWGHSEALAFPWEKVERQRNKFFGGMKFRTVAELADEAAAAPTSFP
ncbi:NADH(P)-binding domain-containing protein [Pochonia chlamydosporia 170]|uniref:NADH(P)-binding domain-containing protein n=1 Tax=Pochonia chlamydosporia 170 TaxID=1380566 RepID=A0A179FKG3_METCM|nr:NADH(P)-binding domain-containing protein [Pochonia chlamydosporia 170]OAQ66115.1 NADH(P)-binding domain-containing protein [Pochonia chlamydosporia 170]